MKTEIIALGIKKIRKRKKLSQKAFAEELGLKWYQIKDIETGRTTPSLDIVCRVSEICSVNLHWLLNGDGEMFQDQKRSEQNRNENQLTSDEINLLNKYRQLSPKTQQRAIGYLEGVKSADDDMSEYLDKTKVSNG